MRIIFYDEENDLRCLECDGCAASHRLESYLEVDDSLNKTTEGFMFKFEDERYFVPMSFDEAQYLVRETGKQGYLTIDNTFKVYYEYSFYSFIRRVRT